MRHTLRRCVSAALMVISVAACTSRQKRENEDIGSSQEPLNVLLQRNGGTGVYPDAYLEPSKVKVHNFGKLRQYTVDGKIYAQPLALDAVNINFAGLKRVVYVATNKNKVYAFDADSPSTVPLWQTAQLRPPMAWNSHGWGFFASKFTFGILGTPAIAGNTMYLVTQTAPPDTETCDATCRSQFKHELFAIDVRTGTVINSRVIAGTASGIDGSQIPFTSFYQLQRPGLLVQNNAVYVAFGSNNDQGPFFGWVFAFNATTLAPLVTVCTTCAAQTLQNVQNGHGGWGGIWQAGGGLVGDGSNTVYFQTGNGAWDADKNGAAGSSIVKLNVAGVHSGNVTWNLFKAGDASQTYGLQRNCDAGPNGEDCPEKSLNTTDIDLGSAAPLLVGSNLLLGGGKEGLVYVLDRTTMGLLQNPPMRATTNVFLGGCGEGTLPGTWPPPPPTCSRPVWGLGDYPHIHGTPVYWPAVAALYVWGEKDYLRRFHLGANNQLSPSVFTNPPAQTDISNAMASPAEGTMPGGMLSLSTHPSGAGIVWGAVRHKKSVEVAPENYGTGTIRAVDALTLQQLWEADQPFVFPKFPTLTIADGRVYAPTNQDQLIVYGRIDRAVSAVSPASQRLDVFFRGVNGNVRHKSFNGTGWQPTMTTSDDLGGSPVGTPVAISVPVTGGPSRMEVFIRKADNFLYRRSRTGSGWQFPAGSWDSIGGPFVGFFTGVSWGPNRFDMFGEGSDGLVYTRSWEGAWTTPWWNSLGAPNNGQPIEGRPIIAVARTSNRLDLFTADHSDKLFWKSWTGGPTWNPSNAGWTSLGDGAILGAPAVVSWGPDRIDLLGRGTDGQVWWKYWSGGTQWVPANGYTALGMPPGEPGPSGKQGIVGSPRAVSWGPNRIDAFVESIDGRIYTRSCTSSCTTMANWTPSWTLLCSPAGCTDAEVLGPPEPVAWGPNRIDLFSRGPNSTLLKKSWGGPPTWIPSNGFTDMGGEQIDF